MAKKKLSPENVAMLNKVWGTSFSAEDIASGRHRINTPEAQREATIAAIEHENFRPELAVDPNGSVALRQKLTELKPGGPEWQSTRDKLQLAVKREALAAAESSAKAELDEATLKNLSPEAKRVALIERDKANLASEELAAKQKAEHFAAIAPTVARLEKLRSEIENEPDSTEADLHVFDRAIMQVRTVGGSPDAAKRLVTLAEAAHAGFRQTKGGAVAERLKALDADRAALLAEHERLTGTKSVEKPVEWSREADKAAREKYFDLRLAHGGDDNHADVAAARSEWWAIADKRPAELQTEVI